MTDRKAEYERGIFEAFMRRCPLLTDPSSIEARQPPEPDICCRIDGQPIAFELVEVLDADSAKGAMEVTRLIPTLQNFAEKQSDTNRTSLRAKLGDGLVWVLFAEGSRREREEAIPALFDFLRGLPSDAEGEYPVGAAHGCPLVRSVTIMRGDFPPGPHFDVTFSSSVGDPIVDVIRRKWAKRYQTAHDIHLLAYYNLNPSRLEPHAR